jgi:hypothetical protein
MDGRVADSCSGKQDRFIAARFCGNLVRGRRLPTPRFHALQPLFLPEKRTGCLAISVMLTAAPALFQMNGMRQLSCSLIADCVAGFVSALVHFESPSAEIEHFWHEGHGFQAAVLVKGSQDLFPASHFD